MSAEKEHPMTFEPAFWHQHWRDAAPSAARSRAPVNPYVLKEAGAHPDLADSAPSAMDVGCGIGTEALALAQIGWIVTAVDTSADALRIAAERAEVLDLAEKITWVEADITSWSPESQYDLVTSSYVHTRLPQPELLRRLAGWAAPGGTVLMVGHAPGHHNHGDHGHPPEEATDQLELLTDALSIGEWAVHTTKTSRTVPLADGQQKTQHKTLHDVVLRAERR